MARQPGLNNFAGTLEVLAGGPLDARCVVPAKSDLTTSGTFPYAYVGMIVSVEAEGKAYILTDLDYTDTDNWTEIGSGGSSGFDNVIEGYFNPTDNLFYAIKDGTTYSEPIAGTAKVIYIDLDSNTIYRFNNPIFVRLDEVSSLTTQQINDLLALI